MDPLSSPSSQEFLDSFHALSAVAESQGLVFKDGHLEVSSGKTTTDAAQAVAQLFRTKLHEVNTLKRQVHQQKFSTLEDTRHIVALLNDLHSVEAGYKNLRIAIGSDITITIILDTAHAEIEAAEQTLRVLETSALDVLADQLPPETRRLFEIEQTTPDQATVEKRAAGQAIPRTSIDSASTRSETICREVRKFADPSYQGWLFATYEGELYTQKPWGGSLYLYDKLPTASQLVYNACLTEIARCEKQVNETLRLQSKPTTAEQSIQNLQELRKAVSQIVTTYLKYYRVDLAQIPADQRELLGYQTLLDTIAKLNESISKLEALIAQKSHIDAASMHQRCVMTIQSIHAAAVNRDLQPKERHLALCADLERLESLKNLVRQRFVECNTSIPSFEATPTFAEFRETLQLLNEAQVAFDILTKELQREAADFAASQLKLGEHVSRTKRADKKDPEEESRVASPIPDIETYTHIHEARTYAAELKQALAHPTALSDVIKIIASIPEEFLNFPEIAIHVRTIAISLQGLKSETQIPIQVKQRFLQRHIDDLITSISTGETASAEAKASLLSAVALLHDTVRERLLDPTSYATLDRALKYLSAAGCTDLPILSTSCLSKSEVDRIEKDIAKPIVDRFWTAASAVMKIASELESTEKQRLSALVAEFIKLSQELDVLGEKATPQIIDELQARMNTISLDMKNRCDHLHDAHFSQLQRQLSYMTDAYNQSVRERTRLASLGVAENDPRMLAWLRHEFFMLKMFNEYNLKFGNASLTTNAFTATKGHVMDFAAVVTKKMDLIKRLPGARPQDLSLILADLAAAPKPEELRDCAAKLQLAITMPWSEVVTSSKAEERHKEHPELRWGESHINLALCTPANWTIVRTALIKRSRSGKMHVAVSKIEPLDIGVEGGVPAGLRGNLKFSTRPANLLKTTLYTCLREGETGPVHVSFRGGQFPTKEAAKKALVHILAETSKGDTVYLHINALLTPTVMTLLKKDKTLLQEHTKNIFEALDELIAEAGRTPLAGRLKSVRDYLAISNCGVNEGAVGETSVIPLYLGWHTSISDYCNPASQRLNRAVHERLLMMERSFSDRLPDSMVSQLDILGPMLQIGQDLEAVYALNHYADASVGQNQFKMPALWGAMDALVGVLCYTDCMSGKDRTGKVESCTQEYLVEIFMNTIDHKQELSDEFDQLSSGLTEPNTSAWTRVKNVVTSACFKKEELPALQQVLVREGEVALRQRLLGIVHRKIAAVREGLGMAVSPSGFMEEKHSVEGGGYFQVGTRGIPASEPKIRTKMFLQQLFPKLAVSSMYAQLSRTAPETERMQFLENRQREAVNRRLSQLSGSLDVTQMNTGKPGFKVEGGDPLVKHSSGFDLEFVLYKLRTIDPNDVNFSNCVIAWTGLHELPTKEGQIYLGAIIEIAKAQTPMEQKILAWTSVLQKIAQDKAESFIPKAKVKA